MIQRGDPITVLHTYRAPVRAVVTTVYNAYDARLHRHVEFDWKPVETLPAETTIFLLSTFGEGWVWARGHGEEQERALLASRALL